MNIFIVVIIILIIEIVVIKYVKINKIISNKNKKFIKMFLSIMCNCNNEVYVFEIYIYFFDVKCGCLIIY